MVVGISDPEHNTVTLFGSPHRLRGRTPADYYAVTLHKDPEKAKPPVITVLTPTHSGVHNLFIFHAGEPSGLTKEEESRIRRSLGRLQPPRNQLHVMTRPLSFYSERKAQTTDDTL